MSAETRSSVGRHKPTSMSADTRPISHHHSTAEWPPLGCHSAATQPPLGRHSAATRPILDRYSANTKLTWSALATEFYLPCSTERGFQWLSSFLAFNSNNIHVFFLAMFYPRHSFYIRPSLLSAVAAFEGCYFRGAKDDIKSWYDCALFLPHGWVFQF